MRTFVVLCLIAAVAGQYDYAPQSGGEAGYAGGQIGGGTAGAAQLSEPIQPASEFSKEFYSYSAPEGEFDDAGNNEQLANSLKKSLRVVFIKGPENSGLENAALQLAKSAGEDRTAIYVLSKQSDIGDLANKLSQLKSNNANKPEVHFVKYRTQADADNAQRTIQSQYDSLPGPSSNNNGGQAQVLDFASKAPARPSGGSSSGSIGGGTSAPSNQYIAPQGSYLPPSRRF